MWCSNSEEMTNSLIAYCQDLFTSANPVQLEEAMKSIHKVISEDMNIQLFTEFMEWEVKAAIKQMTPLKALGPDGIPPFFYQTY